MEHKTKFLTFSEYKFEAFQVFILWGKAQPFCSYLLKFSSHGPREGDLQSEVGKTREGPAAL